MDWNANMDRAPRGEIREGTKDEAGKKWITKTIFVAKWIFLSVVDKGELKAIPSYRTEPNKRFPEGRWAGFAEGQEPHAWAHWPEPADVPAAPTAKPDGDEDDIPW